MASGPPTKRQKGEEIPGRYPGYSTVPLGRYQPPPYGHGGPQMGSRSGYMAWQGGQYGPPGQYSNPPPPHSWGTGPMYPQQAGGPPMTPDRGYGPGYSRGPPPTHLAPGPRRTIKPPGSAQRPTSKNFSGGPDSQTPVHSGRGWGSGGPWPQGPVGPMHRPPGYSSGAASSSMYGTSPSRSAIRPPPQSSSDGIGANFQNGTPPSAEISDMDIFVSRGVGTGTDDESVSVSGGNSSSKDKGRGSYKCGRCGVPKKGHICPYQPKLTRRPGEPLPEMRSAAIQVEMDEFMTMRRLNLRIQGFPESYASEPFLEDDMVVGGAIHPPLSISTGPPIITDGPTTTTSRDMMSSPMRSSPVSDDHITASA